jgi:hypothetical protein
VSNVIERFPGDQQELIVTLLTAHDPDLLSALRARERPTVEQQEALERLLLDELLRELGPGDEPSARGALADRALAELFVLWPVERVRPESPGSDGAETD